VSQPPPEGFQLSADDPMMEQVEAATKGSRDRSDSPAEHDEQHPDESGAAGAAENTEDAENAENTEDAEDEE